MLKRYCFVIIFLCDALVFHAQDEALLHKTYSQRVAPLLSFYQTGIRELDSISVFTRINNIKKLAVDNDDDDLLMEAALMRAHYFYYRQYFPASLLLPMMDSLKEQGVKRNKPWLVTRAETMMALYNFFHINQYEAGFEHFQKMYQLLQQFTSDEFPLKQTCLYLIASAYYTFSDYRKAIFYLQEASRQTSPVPEWHYLSINSRNTIGLCYQKLGQFDSSDHYFHLAYQKAVEQNSRAWQGIVSGNLGHSYFLKKQYDQAIPLLQKDVDIATEYKDWGLASGSLMPLAAIDLERNDIIKAEQHLQQARSFIYISQQYKRLQDLYPLLSKLHATKGNPKLASLYLDSSIYIKDSLNREFNAMLALRAQQKVEREQEKAEVENIIHQKKIKIIQRNILIAVVVLLMFLTIYIYWQQQKKQRLDKEKLKKAEEELKLASRQLDDFRKYISEKNSFIETLQQNIGHDRQNALQQLQKSTILTDDEWEYFRQLFEKVHAGYLQRLKEKFPGLTPAETRFMALSKLNLSSKEMAGTLGVGTDAIRQYRSRLRKKLNLTEEDNLQELINAV